MEEIENWFQIGAGLAAFMAGLVYGFPKLIKILERRKIAKNEEIFSHINTKIWEILTEIRVAGRSSRVSLTQFHNGGKYVDGTSMRRMSITHQSCDQKTSSNMQFRQDSLVSRFVEIVEMLQDNDPDIRLVSEEQDSNTKRFFDIHDTLAFSILPVQCSDSLTIHGYITVEWCNLECLDKLEESEFLSYLENCRNQIAFLINSSKDTR